MFDINSQGPYPCNVLSNLHPNKFVMDDIEFGSIEGFLQGLRYKNQLEQLEVFKLHGIKAKFAGRKKPIKNQMLYYRGSPFDRHSKKYQDLLNAAYAALGAQNQKFRDALKCTGDQQLTHSIGKTDPFDTILTNDEFIGRLICMRNMI